MALEIVITSENKGSNPGGKCIVRTGNLNSRSYIKYCTNNEIPNSPLTPQHQPIYEAMFLEMAKKLGLAVPEYFMLLNKSGKINFTYTPDKDEHPKRLRDNNSTYFASKLIETPIDDTSLLLQSIMKEEKIYRDLLHIGDISGRPQNYTLITPPNKKPFAMYIDLGCALVDTHFGKMSLRKSLNDKVSSIDRSNKALKDFKKRFARFNLKIRGSEDSVNLLEFGEKIPKCCNINVLSSANPGRISSVPVSSLLEQEEIDYLAQLYFLVNSNFLSAYKEDPRISRNH